MIAILIFYIACFFISFFLCIPIGPVNIEIFQHALKKEYVQAFFIAMGAALIDAVWATCAFFGISPFLSSRYMEASFLLFTAIITFILGIVALKDAKFIEKKEEEIVTKLKLKKRWAFLKGLTMVLVNPLGIVSWMIALSFLRRAKIYIPMEFRYEVIFFVVVFLGATGYFSLIIFITNKMKAIFNPKRTCTVIKVLGYILLSFSMYFLFNSMKLFFFSAEGTNLNKLVS